MKTIKTKSEEETKIIAEKIAGQFADGGIIALSGDLGAGKTTFAQGFAKGLKITSRIVSPTFLIIRQYPLPGKKNFFYHIDLYRMENIDLKNSGLEEILNDETNVVLIEWSEKILEHLPENITRIHLKKISGDEHELRFTNLNS
jgi:tRNA threonylcarbamoyladenosine biosynthesis protein TsaE